MPGLFVSFEGTEGGGKSTQIRELAARLEDAGWTVRQLREPGGTDAGEAIRDLLQHDAAGNGLCPEAELLLFAASRAQLVREHIRPALEQGHCVLCDRFMDSSTVYQGTARGLPRSDIDAVNGLAVGATRPDLTILLDLPPEQGMARINSRSETGPDRMESEAPPFFEAVREGYLALAREAPDRFLVLDASRPPDILADEIWHAVRNRLTGNPSQHPGL